MQCLILRRRDLKTKSSTRYEGAVSGRSRCKQGGGTVACCVIAADLAYVHIRSILYSTQVVNIIILKFGATYVEEYIYMRFILNRAEV